MLDIILILIHNLSEIPFCILLVVGMICEKSAHLADLILSTNFQLLFVVLVQYSYCTVSTPQIFVCLSSAPKATRDLLS